MYAHLVGRWRVRDTYMLGFDLYDLLREGLFVETKTQKVSKISEGALHAVGHGLFLRLSTIVVTSSQPTGIARHTLSNAAPLLLKLSPVP